MEPSIELEVEISTRGDHFFATCRRFPGAIGAATSEEAAKSALIESIIAKLEVTNDYSALVSSPHLDPFSHSLTKPKKKSRLIWIAAFATVSLAVLLWCSVFIFEPKESDTVYNAQPVPTAPSIPPPQNTPPPPPDAPPIVRQFEAPLPPRPKDYETVMEDAQSHSISAIETLYVDSIHGVAAAQVRWAQLLLKWGYRREAVAWARRLAESATLMEPDFQAEFSILCLSLRSLSYPPQHLSNYTNQGLRNPAEFPCIKTLLQKARSKSIEACLGLGKFYSFFAGSDNPLKRDDHERASHEWNRKAIDFFLSSNQAESLSYNTLLQVQNLFGNITTPETFNEMAGAKASAAISKMLTNYAPNIAPASSSLNLALEFFKNPPLSTSNRLLESLWTELEQSTKLSPVENKVKAGILYSASLFRSNPEEVIPWIREAFTLNHTESVAASWFVLTHVKKSSGMESVIEVSPEARSLLMAAAEAGELEAQLKMSAEIRNRVADRMKPFKGHQNLNNSRARGEFYLADPELRNLRAEARQWNLRAAKQGSKSAQCELFETLSFETLSGSDALIDNYFWFHVYLHHPPKTEYDFHIFQHVDHVKSWCESMPAISKRIRNELGADPEKLETEARAFKPSLEIATGEPDFPIRIPSSGTAFFVAPNLVVTNAHVVQDYQAAYLVLPSGARVSAMVLKIDANNDLALLQTKSYESSNWLVLEESTEADLADEVFTIGFPNPEIQGKEPKYTDGRISSVSGMGDDPTFYQVTIPVQPGNSGGPLVNRHGQVIGVVTSKLADIATFQTTGSIPQNVNYAVKIPYLVPMLAKLQIPHPPTDISQNNVDKVAASVALIVTGLD